MKASQVILAQAGCLSAAAILALVAVPVRADVLEIGAEGSRWVSGGPLETGLAAETPPQGFEQRTVTGDEPRFEEGRSYRDVFFCEVN